MAKVPRRHTATRQARANRAMERKGLQGRWRWAVATRGGKQRNKQHRDARRSALVVVARRSTLLPLMASGNEKNRALLLLPYSRLRTRAAEGNRNENWSSLFYRAARAQSCPDCSTLLLPLLAVMHARACLQLQAFARCCHHAPLRPVASVGVVTRRRQRAVHRGRAHKERRREYAVLWWQRGERERRLAFSSLLVLPRRRCRSSRSARYPTQHQGQPP